MASKKIDINMDSIKKAWADFVADVKKYYAQAMAWLRAFFKQIDTYEIIAVCAIGVGFLLVIVGIILLILR